MAAGCSALTAVILVIASGLSVSEAAARAVGDIGVRQSSQMIDEINGVSPERDTPFVVSQAGGEAAPAHDLSGVVVDTEKKLVLVPDRGWVDPQLFFDYYLAGGAGPTGGMNPTELIKLQELMAQQ